MVGAKHQRRNTELQIPGKRNALGGGGDICGSTPGHVRQPPRQQQRDHDQHLGQSDGGHGQDQTGRSEESPDHNQLNQCPDNHRSREPHQQSQAVAPGKALHQNQRQGGRGHAEVTLGKVEDSVGPVDKPHPHRYQCTKQSNRDTLQPDAKRHREHQQLHHQQHHRRAGNGPQPRHDRTHVLECAPCPGIQRRANP